MLPADIIEALSSLRQVCHREDTVDDNTYSILEIVAVCSFLLASDFIMLVTSAGSPQSLGGSHARCGEIFPHVNPAWLPLLEPSQRMILAPACVVQHCVDCNDGAPTLCT
jgi:hypothetical protein